MSKIAIIGAGQVGAAIGYTLALDGLAREIALIDLNENLARGEALDIAHGMPLCPPVSVQGGGYERLEAADLVIMTAGARQNPDEDRRALAERNLRVMDAVSQEIVRAAPGCVLLVVTNPVDVVTFRAIERTGFPPCRVLGSGTTLDTLRLLAMLSEATGVESGGIHGFVLGEHGDSELPAWSSVSVAGMSMDEYCRDCGQCDGRLPDHMRQAFEDQVRRAAYRVIRQKGSTCYAIAVAVRRIARAILRDERTILTVSSLLTGEYGLAGMCLSLPCVVGRHGVERVIPVKLTPEEEWQLRRSAEAVRAMTPESAFSR